MASIINATTTGITVTGDNSGQLTLSANGVTALTANTAGYLNFAKQPTIGGVEWPTFSAYSNTAQTFVNGVEQKVTFAVENWDTNNNFASSRFTPTVAGYYQLNYNIGGTFSSSLNGIYVVLYKNGNVYSYHDVMSTSGAFIAGNGLFAQGSNIVYMNGSTDYVEVYGYWAGSGTFTMNTNSYATYFNGSLIRSAK